MNKPAEQMSITRPTVTLELPLEKHTRILRPEQVILRMGDRSFDIGSLCYAQRSDRRRKNFQPCEVVFGSFLKQRPRQILHLINVLSLLNSDGGKRLITVFQYAKNIKKFLDWADASGFYDCLSGDNATRLAYRTWAHDTRERYNRREFGEVEHNSRLRCVRILLEAMTGSQDLNVGIRRVKPQMSPNGGTDPLAQHDFAHAVALNQALFEGLSNLVLEQRPFPYKLMLPITLGWTESYLWLFPTNMWCQLPHKWSEWEKMSKFNWAYDYAAGRLATVEEIEHRYKTGRNPYFQRKVATKAIAVARARINTANSEERNRARLMLGKVAHNAFLFLFFCHTGANESVVREIETDGVIDVTTVNQHFRSIKFRAGGKQITVTVPVTFMPSLRRFMELRKYLLGTRSFPYLFFSLGAGNWGSPRQIISGALESLFKTLLRAIDPQLPRMGSRKLRASVADWYQRHHDASITAKVLQNSEQTVRKRYDAGSATDHREELTLFLNSLAESAKRQRVISPEAVEDSRPLEEGGRCDRFGHPKAFVDNLPSKPNCRDSEGCLFCTRRVLVACEEDVRKVASAAFVMEQVILGPKHEEALRPLIVKCDEDLKKIAAFGSCRAMVERVSNDVFLNGNLTDFFADKYQLFLELGVIHED